jgi:hypothetical protein
MIASSSSLKAIYDVILKNVRMFGLEGDLQIVQWMLLTVQKGKLSAREGTG